MKKISFCTTCKGRLWQLKQTLFKNIEQLDENSEIILLDYQSPDDLKKYIFQNFQKELENGKLKYYSILEDYAYSSAYAKNVIHKLATGDMLSRYSRIDITKEQAEQIIQNNNSSVINFKVVPQASSPHSDITWLRISRKIENNLQIVVDLLATLNTNYPVDVQGN